MYFYKPYAGLFIGLLISRNKDTRLAVVPQLLQDLANFLLWQYQLKILLLLGYRPTV